MRSKCPSEPRQPRDESPPVAAQQINHPLNFIRDNIATKVELDG
jgi:hypothetical protein